MSSVRWRPFHLSLIVLSRIAHKSKTQTEKVIPGTVLIHYYNVIMGAIASQITSLPIVYSIVYSGADQRKHQSPASLHGLCVGNSPVTGEFPAQRASNAENVSIWWRHRALYSRGADVSMKYISVSIFPWNKRPISLNIHHSKFKSDGKFIWLCLDPYSFCTSYDNTVVVACAKSVPITTVRF